VRAFLQSGLKVLINKLRCVQDDDQEIPRETNKRKAKIKDPRRESQPFSASPSLTTHTGGPSSTMERLYYK
jgi:hypothetical protein